MRRLILPFMMVAGSVVQAAGLLVPSGGGSPLTIEEHAVRVDINNGIAVTEIVQVFRNDSAQSLEAIYSFPLPPGASLAGFSMWIHGDEMVGEVLESARAREIYEEIVHPAVESQEEFEQQLRKMDPGLVEEVSYREFRATIFPVLAGGTQRVKLTYYQSLTLEGELLTYVYPMETRATEDSHARGYFSIEVTARSEVPITSYSFPSMYEEQVTVEAETAHRLRAYLERPDGDLDRDFVMTCRLAREETGIDLVTFKRPGEDGYFMMLVTAPDPKVTTVTPVDYTFVVDVSGSMRRQRKLEIAGQALSRFLESSTAGDRFDVIAFNVQPEVLSGTPLPNNETSRESMRRFLGSFRGVGGTDLYPALVQAYSSADPLRPQAIVVLTDGGLNDLDEDHTRFLELIEEHPATVFGIAIGNDANVPLLESLSEASGGFVAQISSQDDLRRRGLLIRERARREPWRGLEFQVSDAAQVYGIAPSKIADLYPGRQIRILGRYRGSGPATFRLEGVYRDAPAVLERDVDLGADAPLNPEIRRMWAERRVHDLLQQVRAGKLTGTARRTVVQLGEEHSIVTPHTSFLVLETEEMFGDYGIERRTSALLEEERQAREQRASLSDQASAGSPASRPPVSTQSEHGGGLGLGAMDGGLLALCLMLLAVTKLRQARRAGTGGRREGPR